MISIFFHQNIFYKKIKLFQKSAEREDFFVSLLTQRGYHSKIQYMFFVWS